MSSVSAPCLISFSSVPWSDRANTPRSPTPALEEITAGVGRLGGVLYRMGECGLDHFAGCVRPFRGPVPEARPEPVRHAAMPSSLANFDSVTVESGFPRRLRNTRPVPLLSLGTSCRIASARPESGTWRSRFAFMRAAGMVQTPASRSISSHVARRTSPDRAALSTRSSNARLVVTEAWEARTVARASATVPWGSARMCWTMACCRPSVWPRASPAGLSGRWPMATAHFITAPIRCRNRRAVSGSSCQIGVRIAKTSAVVTSDTGSAPMRGNA